MTMLIGDLLELLGASALAVAAFLLAGLAVTLIVAGVFLVYQAHFGAYGALRIPRPTTPRINRAKAERANQVVRYG